MADAQPAAHAARRALDALIEENATLRTEVEMLRLLLASEDVPAADMAADWMKGLTAGARHLGAILLRAYPRVVSWADIDAAIPVQGGRAHHDPGYVMVLVCQFRKRHGAASIETVRGVGYALSRAFVDAWRKPRPAAA